MAEKKKQYDNIIDAILDQREPDWKDLGMEDAKKSGEDVADWSHQYVDTKFEDDIAESASRHTPIWGPKSGTHTYEERIAEKEAAAPRINAVTANRRMDDYKSDVGDNESLMDEVTQSIEKAYSGSNLAENSAAKKEISDAQVFKYIRNLLNQGTSPAKVAAKLQKLAEIELFNHQSATDYLQRNAGLMGLAYLEPNTYMDKSSPTYEHTAGKKTAGAPYGPDNPPPIDGENPPDDWEDCGSCGGYHPMDFYGDCRDDYNRWPSGYTTGEKPIDPNAVVAPRPMFGSSNDCVKQKSAWDRQGIKPQAHSVKQVSACSGCTYFKKDARGKTCNLYHLPVVANAEELSQIVNHLTPGVPNNRKHAALVVLANGDDKRVQNPKVAEQTNIVKTADAKVRNQEKRASYQFSDNREQSKHFSSEHVAKMHEKGASLQQIYKWATEKFGDVDTSLAFRGFVQSLKKNSAEKIVVASKDLSFLNSIGIRNAAFEGKDKCASCEFHKKALSPVMDYEEDAIDIKPCVNCGADQSDFTYDENSEVFCTSCGEVQPISQQELLTYQQSGKTSSKAGRVGQKFASKTVDAIRSKQAETKEVNITPAKVRILHQAGHSIEKIYNGVANKIGSVQAKKVIAGYIEDFKQKPGKIAFDADRSFLVGRLGFPEAQINKLQARVLNQRVAAVTARVPDDQHLLSYPGMEKHASEKKATDGLAILNEFDLIGDRDMQDIDTSGPKRDEVEMNDHYKVDLE